MRISDWSSDVCSSDLVQAQRRHHAQADVAAADVADVADRFLQRSQALDDLADFHEQRMRLVGGDQAPAHQGEQGEAELGLRSEERRGGTEGVSTCRYRWSPYH